MVFSEAPERFNASDTAFTPSELGLVMMNSVMLITICYHPIEGIPTDSINITA